MNSAHIRQTFLEFFRSKQHEIVPSAPMVVKNDPTLMFTNAGMNQFKDIFLGNQIAGPKRIADTQKCLRVSGKHNDLEEVGHDTYHHTMFEMLGNWSFGDYFKKEAIAWAWELLTDVYKIDKNRLYVTVFEGDKKEGLEMDKEARDCWKHFIAEDRILPGSKKDNFWEMGDSGPCGPCSEIHVDLRDDVAREGISGATLVNKGNPLVIEIWNLVFIEFNRQNNGQLVPLPARHVDTGMGFERLCMVLQGTQSNYDTDVFQPLIQAIADKTSLAYGKIPKADIAMRVVADHFRAIAFAIADGQLPSNVKAGYVIRRILRRAVRYSYTFLGMKEPFLHELLPFLIAQMGPVFPELAIQKELIANVIREEETAFLRTLSAGIQKFNGYIGSQKPIQDPVIDGSFAFELYDTFGFPIDLTNLMAREIGWGVDMEGFGIRLEEQKTRSRQDATVETSDWMVLIKDAGMPVFTGYDSLEESTRIVKFRKVTSKSADFYHLVLEKTPFYAESGGQVGDQGWLNAGGESIEVLDTLKENELFIHLTNSVFSNPALPVLARVDAEKRTGTASNHSATHLLHAALRQILGPHVEQKGSLVDSRRLRFDFTHFSKLTKEEIAQVETLVNKKIRENIPLREERSVPIEKAREKGAMALFGEKYGDRVRIISFDPGFSMEFCGGTHIQATGQIGMFKIVSEGAIAAGIRRIEAITAKQAEDYWNSREMLLENLAGLLKNPKDLLKGVKNLLEENQELKRQTALFEKSKIQQIKERLTSQVQSINGINFLAAKIELDPESVKELAHELNHGIPDLFLVVATIHDEKAYLSVLLGSKLIAEHKLHAGNIVRDLAKEIGGGGGGQPHFATAGGKNPEGIPAALDKARKYLQS